MRSVSDGPLTVVLTVHIVNAWYNHVLLQRMLHDHLHLQPCIERIQLRTSYEQPVRPTITNYSHTLNQVLFDHVLPHLTSILSAGTCECHVFDPLSASNTQTHSHCITTNLCKVTGDRTLACIMNAGSKLRPEPKDTSATAVITSLHRAFKSFNDRYSKHHTCVYDESKFKNWRDAILIDFATRALLLSKRSPNTNFGSPTSVFPFIYAPVPIRLETRKIRNALTDLHQKTVIVDVDKSTHSVVAVCWLLYVAQVVDTLQNADDYSRVNLDTNHIHMLLKRKLSTILHPMHFSMFKNATLTVAKFHLTVKLHKNPYAFRPIANASKCMFTMYHTLAGHGLRLLLASIRAIEQLRYRSANPPTWWIVLNSIDLVSSLPNRISHICSYDVVGCFTNVVIANLKRTMRIAMDWILNNSDASGIFLGTEGAEWCKGTAPRDAHNKMYYYSMQSFLSLLLIVAEEFYVSACNAIFKMDKGVPMGGPAASECTDLYLAVQEILFMHKIEASHPEVFLLLSNMRRFRDDILSVNNPLFSRMWKLIYSPDMQLTSDSDEGKSCTYLDLKVLILPNSPPSGRNWKTVAFDKWKNRKFKPIRFPDLRSNTLLSQAYQYIGGELYRLSKVNTQCEDFVSSVADLVLHLVQTRNYDFSLIHRVIVRFCKSDSCYASYSTSNRSLVRMFFDNCAYAYARSLHAERQKRKR